MKPDTPTKTELMQRIVLLERERNEHRNAAMEADLRTQAAVRGENLVRDMMQTIISIAHDGSLEKGDRLQRIAVRAAKILCANSETPNVK